MAKKKTANYEDGLIERLKDPEYAAGYLNAVLEDSDGDAEGRFLVALKDVCKAHGLSQLSSHSKLNRQNLYKALSNKGNPELTTITKLLKSMGLRLAVEIEDKAS